MHLALWQFRPLLLGKHVLVRTDNTAAVSYINRLGGIRSHRMSQLVRHLLLWSHTQFKSLRAVHIPGKLNRAADALSRQLTFPGEWRLHPKMIRLIWSRFGEAQVDLFASHESSHCQIYFSLTEGPLGTDALAHSWPQALHKYAFPPVKLAFPPVKLIVRFLKGARRMNPSRSPLVPSWDLSITLAGLQRGPFGPLDSAEIPVCQDSTPDRAHFHQKGLGPPSVFGKRRVPCVRAGLLSRCLETPAWIRAQGSHHALPRSGGEPTSTALGGGRSSLSVAVSRKSIAHIHGPQPELQKLWASLCLPRRSAEREALLPTPR